MQKRRLGKNGREISCLGYGAMSFTNFYGEANDDDSLAILAAALDLLAAVGSTQNLLATGLTHGHRLGLGQTHHLIQDRTGLTTADLHHQVGQHRQLISRGGRVYPALKAVTSIC